MLVNVDQWSMSFSNALMKVWVNVLSYIPAVIAAILVFALGWVIAVILSRVTEQLIKAIKLDKALDSAGIDDLVKNMGFKLNSPALFGGLVKWFIILVFFTISLEMVHLTQVSNFMWNGVVPFIPRIIVAALVLMIVALVADKVKDIVLASSRAAGVTSAGFIANLSKYAIWIFGILFALSQLGIGVAIINMLVGGIVVALSLAFGLAFGLGGKEEAARYLAKMRRELTDSKD